jgi:hypothetical protein
MISRCARQGCWYADGQAVNPNETAALGLFTLRMWSMLRLAVEFRAAPIYCPGDAKVAEERAKIGLLLDQRIIQTQAINDLTIHVPDRVRDIAEAAQQIVRVISKIELDPKVIANVVRLARTVAHSDEASALGATQLYP